MLYMFLCMYVCFQVRPSILVVELLSFLGPKILCIYMHVSNILNMGRGGTESFMACFLSQNDVDAIHRRGELEAAF